MILALITGTGEASNCTRRSRVLFALPVPVTSAINPIFARATMLLIANHNNVVSHAIQLLPLNFMKWVGQTASYSPRLKPVCPSVCRSCGVAVSCFVLQAYYFFELPFVVVESATCRSQRQLCFTASCTSRITRH